MTKPLVANKGFYFLQILDCGLGIVDKAIRFWILVGLSEGVGGGAITLSHPNHLLSIIHNLHPQSPIHNPKSTKCKNHPQVVPIISHQASNITVRPANQGLWPGRNRQREESSSGTPNECKWQRQGLRN